MDKALLEIEIYEHPPAGFLAEVQVAACYLEIGAKLLVLKRSVGKPEPGRWGVPAGKLEAHETPMDAAMRELFEETGISLEGPSQIQSVGALYLRKPDVDYIYHMFKIDIAQVPVVKISNEHQAYQWAAANDLEKMPLMAGAKEVLQGYQAMLSKKNVGPATMKKRSFLQNKLWRDHAVERMEQTGSVIHWQCLDDAGYDKHLRLKLIEESQEVIAARTKEELGAELADLLEIIECLSSANALTMEEVHAIKKLKQQERGSFVGRKYVTVAEHLDDSYGTAYCLAAPEKYPEIC